MRRNLLLVLLLATGVSLAQAAPEKHPAAGDATPGPQAEEGTCVEPKDDGSPAATPCPQEQEQPAKDSKPKEEGPKSLSGMSVLGNQEAPKALVIVPWKSSEIGRALGISPMLDDSTQPVDKEVFLRALSYYEIRSGRK